MTSSLASHNLKLMKCDISLFHEYPFHPRTTTLSADCPIRGTMSNVASHVSVDVVLNGSRTEHGGEHTYTHLCTGARVGVVLSRCWFTHIVSPDSRDACLPILPDNGYQYLFLPDHDFRDITIHNIRQVIPACDGEEREGLLMRLFVWKQCPGICGATPVSPPSRGVRSSTSTGSFIVPLHVRVTMISV